MADNVEFASFIAAAQDQTELITKMIDAYTKAASHHTDADKDLYQACKSHMTFLGLALQRCAEQNMEMHDKLDAVLKGISR